MLEFIHLYQVSLPLGVSLSLDVPLPFWGTLTANHFLRKNSFVDEPSSSETYHSRSDFEGEGERTDKDHFTLLQQTVASSATTRLRI